MSAPSKRTAAPPLGASSKLSPTCDVSRTCRALLHRSVYRPHVHGRPACSSPRGGPCPHHWLHHAPWQAGLTRVDRGVRVWPAAHTLTHTHTHTLTFLFPCMDDSHWRQCEKILTAAPSRRRNSRRAEQRITWTDYRDLCTDDYRRMEEKGNKEAK